MCSTNSAPFAVPIGLHSTAQYFSLPLPSATGDVAPPAPRSYRPVELGGHVGEERRILGDEALGNGEPAASTEVAVAEVHHHVVEA